MDQLNKILFITLSNLGDVILTLPVLDVLRANFPQAQITVMVGPRAKEIFENNPQIKTLIIYDKYAKLREKIKLFNRLKKEKFDAVIDLRNTFYGAFLPCRYRTSPLLFIPPKITHTKERNIYRLKRAIKQVDLLRRPADKTYSFNAEDKKYIDDILGQRQIKSGDSFVVISTGTGGGTRKWETEKFVCLCRALSDTVTVILVGSRAFQDTNRYIVQRCPENVHDFTGLTTLRQLAYLLKRAAVLVSCDTGTLQLASYMDTPTVALFGPSNERKYGPWSNKQRVIKREIFCRPCTLAQCRYKSVGCMALIKPEEVLGQVKVMLSGIESPDDNRAVKEKLKRILIVRTDRIGDLVLSTPVIKAVREAYPDAYLAVMVSAAAREVAEGNPYLDEVIVYDKGGSHRGLRGTLRLAAYLRSKKFNTAVILHPTNRAHLLSFLAGIPRRIGYDRKLGFLLTERVPHTKQEGEKHEAEYNLEMVRYLGIQPRSPELYVPLLKQAQKWLEDLLEKEGIREADKLLAIHPGASCPSKLWPVERFAEVADRLTEKYDFKTVIIAGAGDITLAQSAERRMRHYVLNLAGKTSLSQLAALLKRCCLFISNDSGPVHIASAVGTPVISIFGRNQKGLSPRRWGPLGKKDRFLHKEVGCLECLAHNCTKEFSCIKAITVEDVLSAAEAVLRQ